jgi:RNA polymerase sigma factor (sigma-70 family)
MSSYYKVGEQPVRVEWDKKTESRLHRKAKESVAARQEFTGMFLVYAADIGLRASAGRLRMDDCVSAANRGLARAVDLWKPGGRSRFSTYARKFIRGAVLSEVRRHAVYSARNISVSDPRHSIETEMAEPFQAAPDDIADLVRVAGGAKLKEMMDKVLTARERRIIQYRFMRGWTYAKVGVKLGVTRQRVEQMVQDILQRLCTAYGEKYRRKFKI